MQLQQRLNLVKKKVKFFLESFSFVLCLICLALEID